MNSELHSARRRAGLSVAEVSARAHVPERTVRRLEGGDVRWVTLDQLRRIAMALGCRISIKFVSPVTKGANNETTIPTGNTKT